MLVMRFRTALWCCIFCTTFTFLKVQAQQSGSPYVISDRVGDVIDAQERSYFGLFPRIKDFRQATAYQQTDSTFFFVVENGPDSHVKRTEQPFTVKNAEALELWIDRYETVYNKTRVVPWAYLVKFVKPYHPFRKGGSVDVKLIDGTRVKGVPVYVDANVFVLTTSDQCPACVVDRNHFTVVTPAQMSFIDIDYSSLTRMFYDQRIPQPGRGDIYQRYTLPILRKRSILKKEIPPEIRDSLVSFQAFSELKTRDHEEVDPGQQIQYNKRHKLFLSGALAGLTQAISFPERTDRSATNAAAHEEKVVPPVHQNHGALTFDLARKMWVGAHFQQNAYERLEQDPVSSIGGWGHIAATSQWQASLMAGFKTDPVDEYYFVRRQFLDFFNKAPVIRFGLGLTYASVTARVSKMNTRIENGKEVIRYEHRYSDQSIWGATSQVSAEWYMSRFFAVEIGAHASGYLPFSIKSPGYETAETESNAKAALLTGAWVGLKVSPF